MRGGHKQLRKSCIQMAGRNGWRFRWGANDLLSPSFLRGNVKTNRSDHDGLSQIDTSALTKMASLAWNIVPYNRHKHLVIESSLKGNCHQSLSERIHGHANWLRLSQIGEYQRFRYLKKVKVKLCEETKVKHGKVSDYLFFNANKSSYIINKSSLKRRWKIHKGVIHSGISNFGYLGCFSNLDPVTGMRISMSRIYDYKEK